MLVTALVLTMSAHPGIPGPDRYSAHLLPREEMLQPVLASRGREIYGGVRNVVSGSILTGLGTVFGVLGAYALLGAVSETGSTRTVYTVLGWTSLGFGIVLGCVGIPLLIVGIVRLSNPGVARRLEVSERGLLAVRF